MVKYKVKVIQHMIKGNKLVKSGAIIDESQLIDKDYSLKGGFVELVEETEVKKTSKKTSKK